MLQEVKKGNRKLVGLDQCAAKDLPLEYFALCRKDKFSQSNRSALSEALLRGV